jgi:uncharacterized YkwD family protein
MRKVGLVFSIVLLSVWLAVPAYAAVPSGSYYNNHSSHYNYHRIWFWNWFGWPITTGPTVPSLPRDSKPVQTPTPDKTGPGNSDPNVPIRNLTADENYILKQVNVERTKVGLAPLQIDYRLVQTARAKSQDMITHGYFDHQSPTLGSPFDQMKRAGITYHYAGENIAGNPSAAGAMVSWMNSPGHRANILNPNFTHIGIGIIDGGPYGKILTQQFIG